MNVYFEFLRYCLDDRLLIPTSAKDIDWNVMMSWAEKQAIIGIIYGGVERSGDNLNMPLEILLKFIGYAHFIESRNKQLNRTSVRACDFFCNAGFRNCILKGQGVALYYPNPFLRTPGDIDIWLEGGYEKVISYIKSLWPGQRQHYHHVEIPKMDNVEVEVHYLPSYMRTPWYNHRFQKWCTINSNEQFSNTVYLRDESRINAPTMVFNVVFLLQHMFNHLFTEGIGLRQMIDYYYLLKSNEECHMEEVSYTLKYLNLYNFAGAVMYIMKEVLGLDEKYLIVPVDEKRGKTLLNEILKGGNFGKHSGLTQHSVGAKFFLKIWRNLHFVREYPAEALCEPIFRTWHFFWRLTHR